MSDCEPHRYRWRITGASPQDAENQPHLTPVESDTVSRRAPGDQWRTSISLWENGEPPAALGRCPGIDIYADSAEQAVAIRQLLMNALTSRAGS